MSSQAIFEATENGCGCRRLCIAVAKDAVGYNLIGDCRVERVNLAQMTDTGRRAWLRDYISMNKFRVSEVHPSSACLVSHFWQAEPWKVDWKLSNGKTVCLNAFCVRTGLLPSLVYTTMGAMFKLGIVADDPDRGGTAAAHDAESPQRMQVRSAIPFRTSYTRCSAGSCS